MAVYLNEGQAGCDRDVVAFPHLLLCLGVVLQTMPGFTATLSRRAVTRTSISERPASFCANRGGNALNGIRLYGCGNWAIRYGRNNRRARWRAEMELIGRVRSATKGRSAGSMPRLSAD